MGLLGPKVELELIAKVMFTVVIRTLTMEWAEVIILPQHRLEIAEMNLFTEQRPLREEEIFILNRRLHHYLQQLNRTKYGCPCTCQHFDLPQDVQTHQIIL